MLKATTAPIEDLQLIAWHHMLNDPWLSVYTMTPRGNVDRHWVNPKFAFKRTLNEMSDNFAKLTQQIQDNLFPAFGSMENAFKDLGEWVKQLGLNASLADADTIE